MANGKPSAHQQQKNFSQRLGALEQSFTRFLVGANQRLQGADQRLAQLEEVADALVELNGREDVDRIVNEKRVQRARAESEVEKAKLEEGIKDGYVLPAEIIAERSLVIGKVTGADGKVQEPGRLQLVMPGVAPQFRDKLLGKGVGATLDLPGNGKFEVTEVYSVDEEKAKEVMSARAKAAQDAIAAARAGAESAVAAASEVAAKDEAEDLSDSDAADEAPAKE